MNFEPPDFTKDIALSSQSNGQQVKGNLNNKFQSPLLQNYQKPLQNTISSDIPINKFNSSNSQSYIKYNGAVHNRLGPRNSFRPNNTSSINKMNTDLSDSQQGNRNFNRKRPGDFNNTGPMPARRKWRPNNNRPYYQKQNPNQNVGSVQSRIDRIRSNTLQTDLDQTLAVDNRSDIKTEPDLNESQIDAADITVEVINHNAQVREDSNLVRFKMLLDPKTQAAIKVIQQKRKDKQVIFPFPVTPNVTGISLHERFAML